LRQNEKHGQDRQLAYPLSTGFYQICFDELQDYLNYNPIAIHLNHLIHDLPNNDGNQYSQGLFQLAQNHDDMYAPFYTNP